MSSEVNESAAASGTSPTGQAQLIALPELGAHAGTGAALLSPGSALLDSIAVTLSVVVGQASTTLGQLTRLKESDVLKIDRQVDQPVDIIVNGNIVARGQLVVVDDAFGVRVTEVAAATKA